MKSAIRLSCHQMLEMNKHHNNNIPCMYNESNYMYLRLPITLLPHRATTVRKVIIACRSTSPHKEVSFIKNSENELFV